MSNNKIYIILPAYNEGKVIKNVINEIKKEGYDNIIVVDDGSTDNTYDESNATGVITIKHTINRGKGAATQTGLDAAKLLGTDIAITLDSDGQHDPKDIKKFIDPISSGYADVVIGSRMLDTRGMPASRVIMNKIGNWVTYIFFGVLVSDSQSGFRAYSRKALDSVYTYLDRYEFESEMLGQTKKASLKIKEVPIKVIYSEYSLNKYKYSAGFTAQGLLNGIRMVVRLIENALIK